MILISLFSLLEFLQNCLCCRKGELICIWVGGLRRKELSVGSCATSLAKTQTNLQNLTDLYELI